MSQYRMKVVLPYVTNTVTSAVFLTATHPGYSYLLTRLLKLTTCKSAGLRHPAATAHPEHCGPSSACQSFHVTPLLQLLHCGCRHRLTCPFYQPGDWLSLVSTAELLLNSLTLSPLQENANL